MRTQNRRSNNIGQAGFTICGTASCQTSIIFAGFIAFYIISFLWDIFTILGGYNALFISQMPNCVSRAGFDAIDPALVLVLIFIACFHAISLVWIIGFIHSKAMSQNCLGGEMIDVPTEWPSVCGTGCEWAICIPLTCFDLFMIIQFGLSLYVFLFLEQLIYDEPETFVDKFCVSYEDTEEAYSFMFIALIFFILHIISSCIYCCLLRVATNDVSILQRGQQRITSPPPQDRQPLNPNVNNQQQQRRQGNNRMNNQRRLNQ